MRILLDTHVLIWWDAGEPLPKAVIDAVQSADEVFVSAASAWEIAIKTSLGKVVSQRSVATATEESGFTELSVTFEHAERVASLPSLHRDPFDRLLIAQAQSERLTIVTADIELMAYDVAFIDARR